MAIEHPVITDPYIHEPKGIATAGAGKVYVANGSGSGSWQMIYPADFITFDVDIHLSASGFFVSPIAGTISKIYIITDIANTSTICNVTFAIGSTTITNGAIALAGNNAAGTSANSTPSANNVVAVGNVIQVTSDTGNTSASTKTHVSMLINPRTG